MTQLESIMEEIIESCYTINLVQLSLLEKNKYSTEYNSTGFNITTKLDKNDEQIPTKLNKATFNLKGLNYLFFQNYYSNVSQFLRKVTHNYQAPLNSPISEDSEIILTNLGEPILVEYHQILIKKVRFSELTPSEKVKYLALKTKQMEHESNIIDSNFNFNQYSRIKMIIDCELNIFYLNTFMKNVDFIINKT